MKLFLFDLDGTLVTTGGAGLRALATCFKTLFGLTGILERVSPSGKTDPAIFREIIQTFLNRDMTEEEEGTIKKHYLKALEEEMKTPTGLKIMPGVLNLLDRLKSDAQAILALGTGNLERGARLKLQPTPLNPYFDFGGFGSDAEVRSEVLEIGHKRAQEKHATQIAPSSVYVIGDTPYDVRAAKAAGFQSVAVATGNKSYNDLKAENPDFVVNDLTESSAFLNNT